MPDTPASLHFITTIDHADYKGALERTADPPPARTVGFFADEKDARAALDGDPYDLHENRYEWAVIEEVGSGIYPTAVALAWFRYDRPRRTWSEVPPPETASGTCNFSIG